MGTSGTGPTQTRPSSESSRRYDQGNHDAVRKLADDPVTKPKVAEFRRGFVPFLSYAREDAAVVGRLFERLVTDGYDPWLDSKRIVAGEDWKREIRAAQSRADVGLLCLSTISVSKTGVVQAELKDFLELEKLRPAGEIFLVPIRLDTAVSVPTELSRLQWIDLFEKDGYDNLVKALDKQALRVAEIELGAAGFERRFELRLGLREGLAADMGIEEVRRLGQRRSRQSDGQDEHAVLDLAVLGHQDDQSALRLQAYELDVLEADICLGGEHDASGAGQPRQQRGGLGQHVFDGLSGGGDLAFDGDPVGLAEIADLHQRIDEKTQAQLGRQPARRGMGSIDEPGCSRDPA